MISYTPPPSGRAEERQGKPTAREWLALYHPAHGNHTVVGAEFDPHSSLDARLHCSCGTIFRHRSSEIVGLVMGYSAADALRNVPRMKDGQILVGR